MRESKRNFALSVRASAGCVNWSYRLSRKYCPTKRKRPGHSLSGRPGRNCYFWFTAAASLFQRRWRGLFLHFFALLAQNRFARQADFVAFDGQHFHQHLVVFFELLADFGAALFGDFADMQQAVGSGENFHEGAKLSDADNLAEIGFPDLRGSSDVLDHLQSRFAGLAVLR